MMLRGVDKSEVVLPFTDIPGDFTSQSDPPVVEANIGDPFDYIIY